MGDSHSRRASGLAILETPRLRLRHTRHTDLPALVALWTDLEVTRFLGGPREDESLRQSLGRAAKDPFAQIYDLWPVEERSTGEVIGDCGFLPKEIDGVEEIELVYVFARNRWGRGYATEMAQALKAYAFGKMGLNRLISLIDPENDGSRRVAEKVGMTFEAEVVRPDGKLRRLFAIER